MGNEITNPETGEKATPTEWARRLGIRPETMFRRIKVGMTGARLFTPGTIRIAMEHGGERLTVDDILARCTWEGANRNAVRKRVKAGWSYEDIVTRPRHATGRTFMIRGKRITLKEISKLAGISEGTMIFRMKDERYACDEDLLVKLPKRIASNDCASWKSPKYGFSGEWHTLAVWSSITGINRETLRDRIKNRGWDIGRALTELPWARDPETGKPLKDMELAHGLSSRIVMERLKSGWSPADAKSIPLMSREEICEMSRAALTRKKLRTLAQIGIVI